MDNTPLMTYLPEYYETIREFEIIMDAEDKELDLLKNHINDACNQLLLDSATSGLDFWELDTGTIKQSGASDEDRRAKIRSKLRGTGKIDEELIKIVADSWTNGNVEVSFDGKIRIKFNSFYGVPSNMNAVKEAIEKIIPAHLGVQYDLKYLLVKDVHDNMTINELQGTKLNQFAGGVI